jgi:Helix-turn-helix domain
VSFTAMAWASKQKVKSANQKLVLLMLANYADDEDKCWPSKKTLSEVCCMSKTAICTSILKLEEAGFLKVEKREGTSSIIRLHTGVRQEDRGCPSDVQGVSATRTGGVRHADTNLSYTLSREPITKPSILVDADFEAFWAAYPKRPGNPKKPAKLKYVNARKRSISHEIIMAGVNAYTQSRKGEDPKYTKLAETWLNKECWDVDYPAASPRAADAATISDEHLDAVVNQYKGIASDRMAAKRILAAEIAGGASLDRIVEAAEKYAMHRKQMRYDGIEITVPILETWLKFKWREMDAYFISKSPMRKPILKPVSEKRK